MRLTAPLIAAVMLAGCRQGPDTTPAPYAKLSDRMRATLSWFPWVDDICVKNERRVPDEYCFRFDTPRRWSGVLTHDDYAGNRFYPGLTDYVATQNLPEGPYGHMSMFGHLILIDRMLLERRLPDPAKVPPPPSA